MALLNVTLNGISVDKEIGLDFEAADADIRRIALEELRTGGLQGLVDPAAGDDHFRDFVVDRSRTPEGVERLFLRPKVPFGAER